MGATASVTDPSSTDSNSVLAQLQQQQQQDAAAASQQQVALTHQISSPQSSGIGSFASGVASGLKIAKQDKTLTPTAGTGTSTGADASTLYGVGGTSEMAGGPTGSGVFTVDNQVPSGASNATPAATGLGQAFSPYQFSAPATTSPISSAIGNWLGLGN